MFLPFSSVCGIWGILFSLFWAFWTSTCNIIGQLTFLCVFCIWTLQTLSFCLSCNKGRYLSGYFHCEYVHILHANIYNYLNNFFELHNQGLFWWSITFQCFCFIFASHFMIFFLLTNQGTDQRHITPDQDQNSMLKVICNQRDRFRSRLRETEEVRFRFCIRHFF